MGLVVADLPVAVRILALPALVGLPGVAVVRLLYGCKVSASQDPDSAPKDYAIDPTMRALLSILIGTLLVLPATLGLHYAGISITATSMALTVGTAGVFLIAAATWFVPVPRISARVIPPSQGRLPKVGGVVATVASLTAAVAIAIAIGHHPAARYTTLGFLDPDAFTTEAFSARPAGQVRLNWLLRGFGCGIDSELTTVSVQIDGTPVDALVVDLGAVTRNGIDSELTGSASFAAPRTTGSHSIRLTVNTAARDGSPLPQAGFLTTTLEVAR